MFEALQITQEFEQGCFTCLRLVTVVLHDPKRYQSVVRGCVQHHSSSEDISARGAHSLRCPPPVTSGVSRRPWPLPRRTRLPLPREGLSGGRERLPWEGGSTPASRASTELLADTRPRREIVSVLEGLLRHARLVVVIHLQSFLFELLWVATWLVGTGLAAALRALLGWTVAADRGIRVAAL